MTPSTARVARAWLRPLALFYEMGQRSLPELQSLEGSAIPEPYGRLLVHHRDMTSQLAEFYQDAVALTVLQSRLVEETLCREVVLRLAQTGQPVEYGAIEINLAVCAEPLREQIEEGRRPLGGLLKVFDVAYTSQPKVFFQITSDAMITQALRLTEPAKLYGRCNLLLESSGAVLAKIVEILAPVS